MKWSLIAASNNEALLQSCLCKSLCLHTARDFNVMRGFPSAGAAYNAGMSQAGGDVLVFVHQDVYLPVNWDQRLAEAIAAVSTTDPRWGAMGVFGVTRDLQPRGHLYCTGLRRVLGKPFAHPVECVSLDECVIVLRRGSGLTFDEQLPGFHLYGTDICLEAERLGLRSYIVPAFCVHNTQGMKFLPSAFWRSYLYVRRKWWKELPIKTPCTIISRWPIAVVEHCAKNVFAHYIKGEVAGQRVLDPGALYAQLAGTGNSFSATVARDSA